MRKHLRIAVTALSLTACVVLVALWVRSYWWIDYVHFSISKRFAAITSVHGHVSWTTADYSTTFTRHTESVEDYLQLVEKEAPWMIRMGLFNKGLKFHSIGGCLPYWFLSLLTGLLAGSLWIPWSRRFTLRTLLTATTLIAVVLGVVVVVAM